MATKRIKTMITTVDNPYDPFDDFPQWYRFDVTAGHNTTALLARLTYSSYEISETDQNLAVEQAIDEMIFENVSGLYVKVQRVVDEVVVEAGDVP